MDATRVTTWSGWIGDEPCYGLTIAGNEISDDELELITDHESAIYFGVTEELLELWLNRGEDNYSRLVPWLHSIALDGEDNQEPTP